MSYNPSPHDEWGSIQAYHDETNAYIHQLTAQVEKLTSIIDRIDEMGSSYETIFLFSHPVQPAMDNAAAFFTNPVNTRSNHPTVFHVTSRQHHATCRSHPTILPIT
jgi:hypothetical protein